MQEWVTLGARDKGCISLGVQSESVWIFSYYPCLVLSRFPLFRWLRENRIWKELPIWPGKWRKRLLLSPSGFRWLKQNWYRNPTRKVCLETWIQRFPGLKWVIVQGDHQYHASVTCGIFVHGNLGGCYFSPFYIKYSLSLFPLLFLFLCPKKNNKNIFKTTIPRSFCLDSKNVELWSVTNRPSEAFCLCGTWKYDSYTFKVGDKLVISFWAFIPHTVLCWIYLLILLQ